MKQTEFFPIESPCLRICTSNRQGLCIGCMRTRQERLHWMEYNNMKKREILQKCSRRMRRYKAMNLKQVQKKHHQAFLLRAEKNAATQSSLPLAVTENEHCEY